MRRRAAECADVHRRNNCARAQRAGAVLLVHSCRHIPRLAGSLEVARNRFLVRVRTRCKASAVSTSQLVEHLFCHLATRRLHMRALILHGIIIVVR